MGRIITRQEWRAQHADGFRDAPLPCRGLVLHHSVTIAPDLVAPFTDDDEAVRTLERIGQQRFGGGISYTFACTPVGRLYQGHSVDRSGAHTLGLNSVVRAVVLVGNYSDRKATPGQVDAIGWLLAKGKRAGWWPRAELLGGHRTLLPGHTECPGDGGMASVRAMDQRAAEYLRLPADTGDSAPRPPATDTATTWEDRAVAELSTVNRGDKGADVRRAQGLLLAAGHGPDGLLGKDRRPDGVYGPGTEREVREYQRARKLTADGIVGPRTWRELLGA